MSFRIVADSSCDLTFWSDEKFTTVPMKIRSRGLEFVDDKDIDLEAMLAELAASKEKSSTSCPNCQEWIDAFEGHDEIFVITITSALSGAHNAAYQASNQYMEENPGKKVFVLDSRSTGPEMAIYIDFILDCEKKGMTFEETCDALTEYSKHVHLEFVLKSLHNLVNNGRVGKASAAIAGLLNISIEGEASPEGTLDLKHKCRGEKKALQATFGELEKRGYAGGRVDITNCKNQAAAEGLKKIILGKYPDAVVNIRSCSALCSFYAEVGGLLIGYEDNL